MTTFSKIRSDVLPDIYPSGYVDVRYTANRCKQIGFYEEVIKTSEKYATIYDAWKRERNVQINIYNKYKLCLLMKENDNLELLKYAENVYIDLPDGTIYKALILDANTTQPTDYIGDKFLELEFADINKINYKDYSQPVSNLLRSDKLYPSRFTREQLYYLRWVVASVGTTRRIYTALVPEFSAVETFKAEELINGIQVKTRRIVTEGYKCRFYVNEADAELMINELPQAIESNSDNSETYLLRPDLSDLLSLEGIVPEVQKIEAGVDLYQVDLFIKTAVKEYNPFI